MIIILFFSFCTSSYAKDTINIANIISAVKNDRNEIQDDPINAYRGQIKVSFSENDYHYTIRYYQSNQMITFWVKEIKTNVEKKVSFFTCYKPYGDYLDSCAYINVMGNEKYYLNDDKGKKTFLNKHLNNIMRHYKL